MDFRVEKFDSLESTNKYCEALDLAQVEDFTCFWALRQTGGIGQQGNHWEAAPGQNLTFSIVLHPSFLPAASQFRLTQMLSLALTDCLHMLALPRTACIKWPNDIYVGNKKICGMLVSNRLQGDGIAASICGIGLNVNQTDFPDWVPNPVSLAALSGLHYDLDTTLHTLLQCIAARYDSLRRGENLLPEYLRHLMLLHVPAQYEYDGGKIEATTTGVDAFGRLQLEAADGQQLSCGMKEIRYCI